MKILFTGKSDFTYNRTRILLKGLKAHTQVEVVEYPMNGPDFKNKEFNRLLSETDFVYVPPFRHSDVRGIRKKTDKLLIFDPLISKYLTRTIDHGKWWTAPEKYLRDRIAFKNSDVIVMDTEADKKYIIQKFSLDPTRVIVVPIGVDTSIFKPQPQVDHEKFIVGFHGGFIPLQGVDKIVASANLLKHHEDIQFEIIGSGPKYKSITRQAEFLGCHNICFRGWVNYDDLSNWVNSFDLCLGIFGASIKSDLVVPNKVFEYAAVKKCILTKDTPGIQEIFTRDQNICLCSNDPESIAENILAIKDDQDKRIELATKAYELVSGQYNENKIAEIFVEKMKMFH